MGLGRPSRSRCCVRALACSRWNCAQQQDASWHARFCSRLRRSGKPTWQSAHALQRHAKTLLKWTTAKILAKSCSWCSTGQQHGAAAPTHQLLLLVQFCPLRDRALPGQELQLLLLPHLVQLPLLPPLLHLHDLVLRRWQRRQQKVSMNRPCCVIPCCAWLVPDSTFKHGRAHPTTSMGVQGYADNAAVCKCSPRAAAAAPAPPSW